MIVTEQLLTELGACAEALEWLRENQLFDKTRREFVRILKEATDAPADYLPWASSALFSAQALKQGAVVSLEEWRVVGVGGESAEFSTQNEAEQHLCHMQEAYHATELHMFHIHARTRVGEHGYDAVLVDMATAPPPADYYATFNYISGQYEEFSEYSAAKRQLDELQQGRKALTDQMFHIQQRIQDDEQNTAWDFIA